MGKKILSLVVAVSAVIGIFLIPASAISAPSKTNVSPRITRTFNFNWYDVDYGTELTWHGTPGVMKQTYSNWEVSITTFSGLKYSVGYAMGIPESGVLETGFVYKKGTGYISSGGAVPGSELCLVGQKDTREAIMGLKAAGTWSPDLINH